MSSSDQLLIKNIVKKAGTSFYWGMKLLPKDKRRAMFSVYAFCRRIDDIADDLNSTKTKKIKELNKWKRKLNLIYENNIIDDPICREISFSAKKFKLEKKHLISLIEGMEMDIHKNIQFPSKRILMLYCDKVAVSVGFLSIKIFGLDNQSSKNYAHYLGRAFQLTNIVRDFNEDLERKRCYLNAEKFTKFKIKKKISNLENEPKLQLIFQEILDEANSLFKKAELESRKIDRNKIIASELMKVFYKSIHEKMHKKFINVKKRIKLSNMEKIILITKFSLGLK